MSEKNNKGVFRKLRNFFKQRMEATKKYMEGKRDQSYYVGRGKHKGDKYPLNFIGKRKRYNRRHGIK